MDEATNLLLRLRLLEMQMGLPEGSLTNSPSAQPPRSTTAASATGLPSLSSLQQQQTSTEQLLQQLLRSQQVPPYAILGAPPPQALNFNSGVASASNQNTGGNDQLQLLQLLLQQSGAGNTQQPVATNPAAPLLGTQQQQQLPTLPSQLSSVPLLSASGGSTDQAVLQLLLQRQMGSIQGNALSQLLSPSQGTSGFADYATSASEAKTSTNDEAPPPSPKRRKTADTFPDKLFRLLNEVEAGGQTDIVAWCNDGKAFQIHKPEEFLTEVIPKYFKHRNIDSFRRQLNNYGFERVVLGRSREDTVYANEFFRKDKPELLERIRRLERSTDPEEHHRWVPSFVQKTDHTNR